jgi:L-2,4-diaminobutyric acid acetyltransferase
VQTPKTTSADTLGQEGFRSPEPGDGQQMWALAGRVGLDLNSPYAYVLWGDHFAATSVVVDRGDGLTAFAMGFRLPNEPATLFIWQIGVDESERGKGVAGRMLDHLVHRTGARCLEATVTPSNAASAALFRGLAARHGTEAVESPAYAEDLFPPGHEAEVRFRIALTPPP